MFRYNEDTGTEETSEITFTAQRPTEFAGVSYAEGRDITISLPRPINRATLDDMAGEGGPWGWGYTSNQLEDLAAGKF